MIGAPSGVASSVKAALPSWKPKRAFSGGSVAGGETERPRSCQPAPVWYSQTSSTTIVPSGSAAGSRALRRARSVTACVPPGAGRTKAALETTSASPTRGRSPKGRKSLLVSSGAVSWKARSGAAGGRVTAMSQPRLATAGKGELKPSVSELRRGACSGVPVKPPAATRTRSQ